GCIVWGCMGLVNGVIWFGRFGGLWFWAKGYMVLFGLAGNGFGQTENDGGTFGRLSFCATVKKIVVR
ncbi:hypothetical protein, partial [Enterobacter intestinihominis]